jgi:hypothetical protein
MLAHRIRNCLSFAVKWEVRFCKEQTFLKSPAAETKTMRGADISEITLKAELILRQSEQLTARLKSEPGSLDTIREQVTTLDEKWDLLMKDLLASQSENDRLNMWRARLNRSRSRRTLENGSTWFAETFGGASGPSLREDK